MAVVPLLSPPPPPMRAALRSPLSPGHRIVIPAQYRHRPPPLRSRAIIRRQPRSSDQDNAGGEEETSATREGGTGKEEEEEERVASTAATVAEIKERMAELKKEESSSPPDLWGGVAAEVREIEWPPFGKVLGTTGIVLAVIAGSSVALLTVNAILAEVSDRVFVGRGFQDFFG